MPGQQAASTACSLHPTPQGCRYSNPICSPVAAASCLCCVAAHLQTLQHMERHQLGGHARVRHHIHKALPGKAIATVAAGVGVNSSKQDTWFGKLARLLVECCSAVLPSGLPGGTGLSKDKGACVQPRVDAPGNLQGHGIALHKQTKPVRYHAMLCYAFRLNTDMTIDALHGWCARRFESACWGRFAWTLV